MKFYTSYFAMWPKLPADSMRVSISRYPPDFFKGDLPAGMFRSDLLAPSAGLLSDYKSGAVDESAYKRRYVTELAGSLYKKGFTSFESYFRRVRNIYENDVSPAYGSVIFLCYEKPGEFCHRHILADLMNMYGYDCSEFVPVPSARSAAFSAALF